MSQIQFGCGHFSNDFVEEKDWCPALKQLKAEHIPLREKMDSFYKKATAIAQSDSNAALNEKMEELSNEINAFIAELEPHSEREEGCLFPMVANYIGRENGPIAVMEYEHDQAKENLREFVNASKDLDKPLSTEQAQEMAHYAIQAYTILTDHFGKEEMVLFPMAQKLLNEEEKAELMDKISK